MKISDSAAIVVCLLIVLVGTDGAPITWLSRNVFRPIEKWLIYTLFPRAAYKREYTEPSFYVTLKEFERYYRLNPDAYILRQITVQRKNYSSTDKTMYTLGETFGFKGLSYWRYQIWRNQIIRNGPKVRQNDAYQKFLAESVQSDIEAIRQRAVDEIEVARKELLKQKEDHRNEFLG